MVLSTRIMDEIPKMFVLQKKKITKSCKAKRESGRGMRKFMFLCQDLGNSSREIPKRNDDNVR